MFTMIEFVIKYWVQWLFGVIALALAGFCKKYRSLYQSEKNHQKTKEQQEFYDGLKEAIRESYKLSQDDDAKLQQQIDDMGASLAAIKQGLLSIQRKSFKNQCAALLDESHHITFEEFEDVTDEHKTYNALGGNHDGDTMYDLVVEKYKKQ